MPRSAKGSGYEREVCELLGDWWIGTSDRDRIFWRTSGSGATATRRAKFGRKTTHHCGDVCAVDPIGYPLTELITFELKRGRGYTGKGVTLSDLIDAKKPQELEAWIEQARRSSVNAGTPYWMIVHRRDQRESVVYYPAELYDELRQRGANRMVPFVRARLTFMLGVPVKVALVVTTLEQWFRHVTPDHIRALSELYNGKEAG